MHKIVNIGYVLLSLILIVFTLALASSGTNIFEALFYFGGIFYIGWIAFTVILLPLSVRRIWKGGKDFSDRAVVVLSGMILFLWALIYTYGSLFIVSPYYMYP